MARRKRPAGEDDIVITPGGPRPRSATHHVPPGAAVERLPGGGEVVVARAPRRGGDTVADDDYVLTPGGLRHRSLVHHVPPGHELRVRRNRLLTVAPSGEVVADHGPPPSHPPGRPLMPRQVVPPRPRGRRRVPAFGSGWITYASWSNTTGTPVSRFTTTWTVPPAPRTSSGQTIFLFNGIQNSTMIYQPVLQWGPSAAGGGARWSVASWYADGQGGQSFYSTLVDVNVGDVLVGVMTLTGRSPRGFSYDSRFTGIANTDLTIANVDELTWCIETLEAYSITRADDYPDTALTAMSAIGIDTGGTQPALTWTINNDVTDTGQHTLVVNELVTGAGEVDLWYRPSPYWVSGFGTIAPGASQDWWFSWGGTGDVGPQLIQAQPLEPSGELVTTMTAESVDANGHTTYHATVRNDGPSTVRFHWRGGGR
jgi:hypothetical protein